MNATNARRNGPILSPTPPPIAQVLISPPNVGPPQVIPAAPRVRQPLVVDPAALAEYQAKYKSFEAWVATLMDQYPYQIHFRAMRRSGKSTATAALVNHVQSRPEVHGPTDVSDRLREQAYRIIQGEGTSPTPVPVKDAKEGIDGQAEFFEFSTKSCEPLAISFPHDPIGGPSSRELIAFYLANPRMLFVPVNWAPRTDKLAARNVFFGTAGELQRRVSDSTDPRDVLRASFRLSFNEFDDDAMEEYGADGLDELMADDNLKTARIRVSDRRGPINRLTFEGFGKKSKDYESILVELSEKVVQAADLNDHNAYREILSGLPNSLIYACGWDLVVQSDALFRQSTLPDEIFRKFMGPDATRTNKNLFLHGSVRGRVKVKADQLGKVYVEGTDDDGIASLLRVFEERQTAALPQPVVPQIVAPEPVALQPVASQPVVQAAPINPPAPPAITASEKEVCLIGDERREAAYRLVTSMPLALGLVLLATWAGVRGLSWFRLLAILFPVLAAGAVAWAAFRTRFRRGSWEVLGSGETLVTYQAGRDCAEVPTAEVTLVANSLERLLDTGRCYLRDDVRAWRVWRLARLETALGKSVDRRGVLGWSGWALVGVIAVIVVRLLVL